MQNLMGMVDRLIEREDLPWERSGSSIDVHIGRTDRYQRIYIDRRGSLYILHSVVVGTRFVTRNRAHWNRLAYRAWRKNAQKELVTFAFDDRDRLVGIIEQPVELLSERELQFYIETLAKECDRFEYVLTGEDAE